jgi:fructokinase
VRVIGIGEILWDKLPSGSVIGGAPFNVVAHLARLGHEADYVTAVGGDEPGRAAIAEVRACGVGTSLIQVTEAAPTGVARVRADALGSVRFDIARPAAFEEIRLDGAAPRRAASPDGGPASWFSGRWRSARPGPWTPLGRFAPLQLPARCGCMT